MTPNERFSETMSEFWMAVKDKRYLEEKMEPRLNESSSLGVVMYNCLRMEALISYNSGRKFLLKEYYELQRRTQLTEKASITGL